MNILALETSIPQASLVLVCNGDVVVSEHWETERNHDSYLFPALQKAMNALGSEKPELILVGSGPGSYGGVRVALAAAVGLAQVTDARIAAICSWAQLAEPGAIIVSDARRGNWTIRREDGSIAVITDEQLPELLKNGYKLLTPETGDKLIQKGIHPYRDKLTPTADGLVRTWLAMSDEEKNKALATPAEPIYVRPPHITTPHRKPWEIRH